MSDDFGTMNLKRGREIEVLRHHYRRHRESLVAMIDEAPTQHLALEYQRLVAEIDRALSKLDEIEGGATERGSMQTVPAFIPPPPAAPRHPARAEAIPPPPSSAGMRPLAGSDDPDTEEHDVSTLPPDVPAGRTIPSSRLALIAGVAVLALALIGWLIWRASSESDRGRVPIVDEQAVTTAEADPVEPDVPVPPSLLAVTPASQDYGVIRKGARATRQFELTNNTEEPMSIQVARSTCRCLYYEHAPVIPPKAKETLTVTVDGARAKAGDLRETLRVTTKSDAAVGTSLDVIATVQ
jgi:hypothetical protein